MFTPEEKAYLNEHPRLIAYHDQLQLRYKRLRTNPNWRTTSRMMPPRCLPPVRRDVDRV